MNVATAAVTTRSTSASSTGPQVVQRLAGPERRVSASISADGSLVAIAVHPLGAGKRTPLAPCRFADGRLANTPAVPAIPGWTIGDQSIHAEFLRGMLQR